MRRFRFTTFLFFLFASGCASRHGESDTAKPDDPPGEAGIAVHVQPAEMRTISELVTGLGRCEPLPDKIAALTPAIEGQVGQILVKLGDDVQQGQPIVQLDAHVAQAGLAEKTATRDGLIASLKLLKSPPRAEELKSQESAVEQGKLSVEKARATVERLRPLATKQEISSGQMYEAELAASLAKLQQEAAEDQLQVLKLGPRAEAIAEAEARIAIADASCALGQAQLEQYTLKSPISGVLDVLTCQLGQTLSPGSAIGTVIEPRKLVVSVWLPVRDAVRVKLGQSVSVVPSSANEHANATIDENPAAASVSGKVTFVAHAVDPQTGNLLVQILIDNANERFAAGQMVSASITVTENANILAVPVSAISDFGEGPTMSIVRDGKSTRLQPKLGLNDSRWVEIAGSDLKEPLKVGELVIVEGGYNLPDGSEVKIATNSTAKEHGAAEPGSTETNPNTPSEAPAAQGEPQ